MHRKKAGLILVALSFNSLQSGLENRVKAIVQEDQTFWRFSWVPEGLP